MINEITCKHYLTLKNCTPITALACQLAEALGPVCNRIYYVLLESHLGMWPCYQTSDTLSFPPPQALLSTHSRRFWAEFPSRRFWLVTMLRTVPQSNLQKHSGEQASHSGWAMWFTKLTPSHMTSARTDSCLENKQQKATATLLIHLFLKQQLRGTAQNNSGLEMVLTRGGIFPYQKVFNCWQSCSSQEKAAKLHLHTEVCEAVQTTRKGIMGRWYDNIPRWEIQHSTGKKK